MNHRRMFAPLESPPVERIIKFLRSIWKWASVRPVMCRGVESWHFFSRSILFASQLSICRHIGHSTRYHPKNHFAFGRPICCRRACNALCLFDILTYTQQNVWMVWNRNANHFHRCLNTHRQLMNYLQSNKWFAFSVNTYICMWILWVPTVNHRKCVSNWNGIEEGLGEEEKTTIMAAEVTCCVRRRWWRVGFGHWHFSMYAKCIPFHRVGWKCF